MNDGLRPAEHTDQGLATAFEALGQAGGWFDATQRLAIARETRAARRCAFCRERGAALSPYSIEGTHTIAEDALSPAQCSKPSIASRRIPDVSVNSGIPRREQAGCTPRNWWN